MYYIIKDRAASYINTENCIEMDSRNCLRFVLQESCKKRLQEKNVKGKETIAVQIL